MMGHIVQAGNERIPEMMVIWEASVRATHDFLPVQHIDILRPVIASTYMPALQMHVYEDDKRCALGFIGVSGNRLEMLFVSPDVHGRGVGKELLMYAVHVCGVTHVDVNEQNPKAVGFYLHMGFKITGRSEVDGEGNPFPLLHLQFAESMLQT
jgi:putative acetyltransferase